QLGLGDTKWRGSLPSEMGNALPYVDLGSGRKAISVQAAHNRTCVLLDDHTMKCWGLAPGGGSRRGTLPGEMGDNLPIMKLGPGRTVAQLGVARYMVCALLDNQGLSCWDSLNEAAVVNLAGLGRPVQFAHLSGNVGVRFDDGTVRHVQYEGIGKPRFAGRVPLTNRARYIGGYETRSCAILVSGATECWEHANSMSLDSPSPFSMREAATFAHGESFRCVVGTDSIAACWGYGFAAGAPGPLPSSPITLVAGWDHVCALLVDDTVRCWGRAASSDPRYGGSSPGPTAADPWPAVDLGTRP
ncbi:MAG TPA: RCC1 domain-containing protein, partial [Polyangia bacterium]